MFYPKGFPAFNYILPLTTGWCLLYFFFFVKFLFLTRKRNILDVAAADVGDNDYDRNDYDDGVWFG